MQTKVELLSALERLQKRVLAVEPDDIDALDELREELTDLADTLLQEKNPYRLSEAELTGLQEAFSQIMKHAEHLASIISERAKQLQHKSKAAASYLKHS